MMAIIVAGLGSAPIRRLHKTWEGVSKQHVDYYKQMDTLLDSRVRELCPILAYPLAVCYITCCDITFGEIDFLQHCINSLLVVHLLICLFEFS